LVADGGIDGGRAPQFAFDAAEHAALLARDEDAARVLDVVAAVAIVHVGALDRAAGECKTNTPPGARALVVVIEALTPNS